MSGDSRIGLRAFELSDASRLHELLNEPALLGRRYLEDDNNRPLSHAQIEELLGTWIKPDGESHLAVVEGETLVGIGLLDATWDPLSPFVAVVIGTAHQRQGFGTAVLDQLMLEQFGSSPALAIETWVDDWNEPGLAFAEQYGFREAGRVRREGIRNGTYFAAVGFDLTRDEWQARHGH
jgi:RimJ/RimL family protein N-acetyltransferase